MRKASTWLTVALTVYTMWLMVADEGYIPHPGDVVLELQQAASGVLA